MFWYDTLRAAPASWRGVDGRPPGGDRGGPPQGPARGCHVLVEQALPVLVASDARPIEAGRGVRRPGSRGAYDRGRTPRPRRARGRIAGTGEPPRRRVRLRSEESPTRPHAHGRDW